MTDHFTVVFVLGGPGSGKGTQCNRVVEKYGWRHLSAGDLLRAEVASGSTQGAMLQDIMNEGGIVPVEITIGLLQKAMAASDVKKFLVDGFPRALDQIGPFEKDICAGKCMMFLDCPESVMQERLLGRQEGRADDNVDTIQKRFAVFKDITVPVIEQFRAEGRLRHIMADRSPDDVFADVSTVIEGIEAGAGAPPTASAVPAAAAPPKTPPPVVVVGPSGVGKGTLIELLMKDHAASFGFTVSHTTRAPRPGEVDGKHYRFTTVEQMEADIAAGRFVEFARVHDNLYGTSVAAIEAVAAEGKIAVLDIDVQGAELVKQSTYGKTALFVFIAPPSMEELEVRLRGRGTEDPAAVERRLTNAAAELEKSREPGFADHVIVNGTLEVAYAELLRVIAAHAPGTIPPEALARAAAAPAAAGGADVDAGVRRQSFDFGAPATSAPVALGGLFGTETGAPVPAAAAETEAGAGPLRGGADSAGSAGQERVRVKDYLEATVVPVLREALKSLNRARPDDPLQHMIDFFTEAKRTQGVQ